MSRKSLLVLAMTSLVLGICATSFELHAQVITVTGGNAFGCTNREYFDEMISYIEEGNGGAFPVAFAAGVLKGICKQFKKGEELLTVGDGGRTNKGLQVMKVRKKGESTGYWTLPFLFK